MVLFFFFFFKKRGLYCYKDKNEETCTGDGQFMSFCSYAKGMLMQLIEQDNRRECKSNGISAEHITLRLALTAGSWPSPPYTSHHPQVCVI